MRAVHVSPLGSRRWLLPRSGFLAGCGEAGSSGTEAPATDRVGRRLCAGRRQPAGRARRRQEAAEQPTTSFPRSTPRRSTPAADRGARQGVRRAGHDEADRAEQGCRHRPQDAQGGRRGVRGTPTRSPTGIAEGRRRQDRHRCGQLQREPDARRALRDRADGGRLHATVQQIGNRELYEPALEKGEIQVVPEYAARSTEFLNKKVNGANAPAASLPVTSTRRSPALKALGDKVGLTFGKASAAQDQNAFAVTKAFADKYGVTTLSRARREVLRQRPRSSAARRSARSGRSASPAWSRTYKLKAGKFCVAGRGRPADEERAEDRRRSASAWCSRRTAQLASS